MLKINSLKQKVNELNGDLDSKQQLIDNQASDLNKFEFICKEQEGKICQYSSEVLLLKNDLENAHNKNGCLSTKLNDTESKYEHALKTIDRLENNANCLNEIIMELKFKVRIY